MQTWTSSSAILRCTCQQPTLVRCFLLCVRGSSSGLCVRFNRGCLFCGLRHRSSEEGNINFLWAGNRVVSLLYCVGRGEGSEEGCSSRLEAWLSRINLHRGREQRLKKWTWLWHRVRVGNIQNCTTYLLKCTLKLYFRSKLLHNFSGHWSILLIKKKL